MWYQVKTVETIAMTLEIEAASEEEAIEKVRKKYHSEEIVVEQNERPEVEFIVFPIA